LVTPLSRRKFSGEGKALETLIEYSKAVAQVAAEFKVSMLDSKIRALYESFG
jgi:hypothetical protein